ncbi:hypothetical protein F5Y01DRAFT_315818 [Xylaria sp. FL0043]|nr:hypothetical protein F5Y01DRAFT_315818 [Xylaria sp. FL0043]
MEFSIPSSTRQLHRLFVMEKFHARERTDKTDPLLPEGLTRAFFPIHRYLGLAATSAPDMALGFNCLAGVDDLSARDSGLSCHYSKYFVLVMSSPKAQAIVCEDEIRNLGYLEDK